MNNEIRGKELFPELAQQHAAMDHPHLGRETGGETNEAGHLRIARRPRGIRVLAVVARRLTSIEGMFVAAEVGIFVAGLIVLLRAL